MSRYYQKVLRPDERLKFLGRLHWFIYCRGILCLVLGIPLFFAAVLFSTASADSSLKANDQDVLANAGAIGEWGAGLIAFMGLISIILAAFKRKTTEIVVTDHRVIFKRGFVSRNTIEMNISKIETVDVEQGVLGRIFGFGTIILRGTGSTFEPFKNIMQPIKLRNSILIG